MTKCIYNFIYTHDYVFVYNYIHICYDYILQYLISSYRDCILYFFKDILYVVGLFFHVLSDLLIYQYN